MGDMQKIKPSKADSLKWAVVVLLLLAALILNYVFASWAVSLRLICWIAVISIAAALAALTATGRKIIEFAKESQTELRKVVWPTRQETVQTTIIVVVMVGVLGILLWGVDSSLLWAVGKVTQINR